MAIRVPQAQPRTRQQVTNPNYGKGPMPAQLLFSTQACWGYSCPEICSSGHKTPSLNSAKSPRAMLQDRGVMGAHLGREAKSFAPVPISKPGMAAQFSHSLAGDLLKVILPL
jgi:hypothetical protein